MNFLSSKILGAVTSRKPLSFVIRMFRHWLQVLVHAMESDISRSEHNTVMHRRIHALKPVERLKAVREWSGEGFPSQVGGVEEGLCRLSPENFRFLFLECNDF